MPDKHTSSPRRWPWFFLAAVLIASGAAGVFWIVGPKIWTDEKGVRVFGNVARIRNVVWDPPHSIGPDFQSDQQQYEPSLSPDGTEFYFVRNKPGQNADIYVSYRRNNGWTQPAALEAVNSSYDDLGPRVTADGRFLLFYSDRPGGFGGFDLWASPRTAEGWGKPFNLGPGVNSEYNEFSPDPTPDGKHLIFATNRKAAQGEQKQAWRATIRESGNGDYDLWIADVALQQTTADASEPAQSKPDARQLESPEPGSALLLFKFAREIQGINTPFMEGASCMSAAGDFLYFASNRPGGFGKFDIYRSRVSLALDGSWSFAAPENVGPQINTADNETDPSIALNGFRLYFSTDRESRDGVYRVLVSDSREVFPLHEARPLPHLGASVWVMLASLLALVPLLLFLRGWDDGRLGLLQKCLLLSLLVHVGICFALSFLKVTAQAYHLVRQEMGVEIAVALNAPRDVEVGYAIRRQSSSDLAVPGAPPEPVAQSRTPLETAVTAAAVDVSVPRAPLEVQSQSVVATVRHGAAPLGKPESVSVATDVAASVGVDAHLLPAGALRQSERPWNIASATVPLPRSDYLEGISDSATPSQAASIVPPTANRSEALSTVSAFHPSGKLPALADANDSAKPASEPIASEPAAPSLGVGNISNGVKPFAAESEKSPTLAEEKIASATHAAIVDSTTPAESSLVIPRSLPATDAGKNEIAKLPATPHATLPQFGPDDGPRAESMFEASDHGSPSVALVSSAKPLAAAAELSDAPPADSSNPTTRPIADTSAQKLTAIPRLEPTPPSGVSAAPHDSLANNSLDAARSASVMHVNEPAPPPVTVAMSDAGNVPNVSLPQRLSALSDHPEAVRSEKAIEERAAMALATTKMRHAPEGGGAPSNIPIDAGIAAAAISPQMSGKGGVDLLESHAHPAEVASATVAPDIASFVPPPADLDAALPKVPESPFRMRAAEQHKPVIEKLGGTPESETAVERGLAYLASVQETDGHWTLVSTSHRALRNARSPHDTATTGLATLAFLAQDHRPDKPGPYQHVVSQSLDFLIAQQQGDGDLRGPLAGGGADQGNMYDQGIATLALAEAALITRDSQLTQAALKGARFIIAAQNRETGGWRYIPNEYGDSSVFGWQVMALHSAEQLGFEIPVATRRGMVRYISLASSGTQRMLAGYQPREQPTAPMTAEIVFCRMLLGQQLNDDEAEEVSNFLGRQPPQNGNGGDIYYWYYGSLCLMQMHADAWKQWNTRTRDMLVRTQRRIGESAGYWDNLKWSDRGGRVFSTAMATLTLEVYYRYLPLQKKSEQAINAGAQVPAN